LIDSGDAAQLKAARAELDHLKSMNQVYLTQLDSTRASNRNLADQNVALNSNLTEQQKKVNSLTQENALLNSKVAAASMLKASGITTQGVKYKSNGKEIVTNKAVASAKIKTCFTILENTVASAGNKDVYLRLISPDGAVMSTSSETFMIGSQASLYTVKETFDYANKETNVCVYWEKGSALAVGKYTVEIYCEGGMIGNTSLDLK
jgi:hypothetical protein